MNDRELAATLKGIYEERTRLADPPALHQRVLAIPATRPHRRRWAPAILQGRPASMFTATKFAAAAVVVALFGGFLLAGIVTGPQDGEPVPGAATASPTAETEPTTTTPPMTTYRLPAGFVTEEVRPGIVRVLNDGIRDLDRGMGQFVMGRDGSIWRLDRGYSGTPRRQQGRFLRLGREGDHQPPNGTSIEDLEVAADGTIWAVTRGAEGKNTQLRSYDGSRWTTWSPPVERALMRSVAIASNGKVWASWAERGTSDWRERTFVGSIGPDGWQRIEPAADRGEDSDLVITDANEPILQRRWSDPEATYATRYRDGAWEDLLIGNGVQSTGASGTTWFLPWHEGPEIDASDGTILGVNHSKGRLQRVDGQDAREWGPDDGVPVLRWLYKGWPADQAVAPDDSLWLSYPNSLPPGAPPDCEGVARFDGERWTRFLTDHCLEEIAIADDGTVWASGWIQDDEGNKGSPYYTYVIRPDVVAAGK